MSETNDSTLEVRRSYPASRQKVFRAWTEAQTLARWFAPSEEYEAIVHSLEVRVGGGYRIEMKHSNGASHCAYGEYREVVADSRLSFTWRWEDNPTMPETLVTVDLRAAGDSTELVLIHQRFAEAKMRDEHTQGWTAILERLAHFV